MRNPAWTWQAAGGGYVELYVQEPSEPELPPGAVWTKPRELTICAARSVLRLTLPDYRPRQHAPIILAEMARQNDYGLPMSVLILIAVMERTGRLPGPLAAATANKILANPALPDGPPLPLSQLRELVADPFSNVPEDPPAGRWNQARIMLLLGERYWRLSREEATKAGTTPLALEQEQYEQRMEMAIVAGIALQEGLAGPPAGWLHPDPHPADAWLDYAALRCGPDGVPAALLDIGRRGSSLIETSDESGERSLSADQADRLLLQARHLLADVDRPYPRHIGQALDVRVLRATLPQLAAWEIATLRVVPHPEGLWVACLDADGEIAARAWWAASPEAGERAPVTIPPACWVLLHTVLAALWHDLCADAIEIEISSSRPHRQPQRERERKQSAVIQLPPTRYYRAHWMEPVSDQTLEEIRRGGNCYRRLPDEWEERRARPDFIQRQRQAAERAERHGAPPPPPGYTYVRPWISGPDAEYDDARPSRAPRRVISRGLLSLILTLDEP